MFEFIRKKSIDYFRDIYFDDIQATYNERKSRHKVRKLSPEESERSLTPPIPKKAQVPVPKVSFKESSRSISGVDIEPSIELAAKSDNDKEDSKLSTQSKIIDKNLKIMTEEMSRLMQGVMKKKRELRLEVENNKVAGEYWNYIYKGGVYLQQILSDVNTAHDSTLFFSMQGLEKVLPDNS